MALTETQVKALKPGPKKQKVQDGDGLYVEVLPTGRKTFRFRYRFGGKQQDARVGSVDFMRLAEARKRRDLARAFLERGEDPTPVLKAAQTEPPKPPRDDPEREDGWARIADAYLTYRRRRGGHYRTMVKVERQVRQTVAHFANRPVGEITAADILELVRPAEEAGKIEAAHELRTRCAQILDFAESVGHPNANPARKVTGAMMPRARGKWPGLTDPDAVGKLMRDIRGFQNCEPETRWGLLLSAYLFPRSEQLRGATWEEIDLDAALWEVPGRRMKGRFAPDHLVPLPRQALAILDEIRAYTGGVGYVVPSPRGVNQKLSEMSFNAALKRMGYCTKTVHCHHGFRTTASTQLNEMGFNRDWIERQLSHVDQDSVRGTYNKAQYIDGRTEMMQAYADWLDEVSQVQ